MLEDLVDACSEALYEYEGIDKGVSTRTVQMDIQMMRSDKLGYNAPIIVLEKKYYTYEDPDYSITNIPLTDQDLGKLTEVVEILRQFKGFNHFQDLIGMVQRLENKIYAAKTNQEPVIDFEKNEHLKGLEHIDTLYQAIIKKCCVQLTYQSFKARSANTFNFHPYYLKEYRNRWFVIGIKKKGAPVLILALDRIIGISEGDIKYVPKQDFSLPDFLKDVIGVTVNQNTPAEKVLIKVDIETTPYIMTKPLHHSQQVVEKLPEGTIFSLNVQLNYELEREILGFGDHVKVIAPENLRRRIRETFENALHLYQGEFNIASLQTYLKKIKYNGFCVVHYAFSRKEINKIKSTVHGYFGAAGRDENTYAIRNLLQEIPQLKSMILNSNMLKILKGIRSDLFIVKAVYFDKTPDSNWYVTWHQDIVINVKEKIEMDGFTGWTKKQDGYGVCPPEEYLKEIITVRIHLDDTDETNGALKVIPGSHQKRLSDEDIKLITQNSIPHVCEVKAGSVQFMSPLLLHASSKSTSQRHRRVIHLELSFKELPGGLEWAERCEC